MIGSARRAPRFREKEEAISSQRLGRIALFYPYGAFSTVAGLLDATRMLSDAGYEVEVYYRGTPEYAPDRLEYPGVTITDDKPGIFTLGPASFPSFMRRGTEVYTRLITHGPHRWWRRAVFLPYLRRRHAALPYVCFFGLDWHGLVAAGPLAAALGIPLAYWSLELMFRDALPHAGWEGFKEETAEWSRRADFVIIQDPWRAAALVADDGVDPEKVVIVPNAPRGRARRDPNPMLRTRHGIAPGQRIVLCSGFFRPWAMSLEIVESAPHWGPETVLYMQSKVTRDHATVGYSERVIRAAESGGVLVGLDPVPAGRFEELVQAADVGLAFYNPRYRDDGRIDRNLELIGYSSGKLADYLHAGLPVVVNRLPGPSHLVEEYGCGVCVDSPDEIGAALRAIGRDYDSFSANACRCFDEALELERHFRAVIDRLELMRART